MKPDDFAALLARLKAELTVDTTASTVGIIGYTPITLELIAALRDWGAFDQLAGVYGADLGRAVAPPKLKPIVRLREDQPDIVVIASDEEKERLLTDALDYLSPDTRIVIGGFSHFGFSDPLFLGETKNTLLPSLANGYPHSLIHIFQCLKNAARLDLEGIVVEFGMFKGGTTMLMSQFVEKLHKQWKIFGFDSFAGFPPRRSPLDMYAHPDCVFLDEPAIRRLFQGRNVEIISGDIVETAKTIEKQPIVLAFIDTDNYTSASAVLSVIQDHVVPGGAIVFDHFTGRNRFLYTLGERFAAKRLLEDKRYFNLHGTGVFLRQR